MKYFENILEILSPVIAILMIMAFNSLFPTVSKDFLLVLGVSLTVYGISISILSLLYYKKLRAIPGTLKKLHDNLSDINSIKESYFMLPLEYTLNWEKTVKNNVNVITYDLSWNIDEAGTPQPMFETIICNLKRGIKYNYYIIDASHGTKQDLELLKSRMKERLSSDIQKVDNFNVIFIEKIPLLFSFALFDIDLPGRDFHGFIFVHTLNRPMAIPMNLDTFKHAREILYSINN